MFIKKVNFQKPESHRRSFFISAFMNYLYQQEVSVQRVVVSDCEMNSL